ncbi:hypothetical protein GCM10023197_32230 [Gordonia humi]
MWRRVHTVDPVRRIGATERIRTVALSFAIEVRHASLIAWGGARPRMSIDQTTLASRLSDGCLLAQVRTAAKGFQAREVRAFSPEYTRAILSFSGHERQQ